MAPAAPASRPGAILGLLILTAFVLWIAAQAAGNVDEAGGHFFGVACENELAWTTIEFNADGIAHVRAGG